jgi:hypothetical protein
MVKTEIFPIRCEELDLPDALSAFPSKIANFLGKYLGLPYRFGAFEKLTSNLSSTRS